jgi:hypothetical protein
MPFGAKRQKGAKLREESAPFGDGVGHDESEAAWQESSKYPVTPVRCLFSILLSVMVSDKMNRKQLGKNRQNTQ